MLSVNSCRVIRPNSDNRYKLMTYPNEFSLKLWKSSTPEKIVPQSPGCCMDLIAFLKISTEFVRKYLCYCQNNICSKNTTLEVNSQFFQFTVNVRIVSSAVVG